MTTLPIFNRRGSASSVSLRKRIAAGFTLLELLAAVSMIAILALLLSGIVSRAKMQADGVSCLSNMRQCGQALLQLAGEQDGILRNNYSGAFTENSPIKVYPWPRQLYSAKYISEEQLLKLRCKSAAARNDQLAADHYGFYMGDPLGVVETDGTGRAYRINVRIHPKPSSSILLADSISAINKVQSSRIYNNTSSDGSLHLRHSEHANAFFLDGHSEMTSLQRLGELGVIRAYDKEMKLVTVHP